MAVYSRSRYLLLVIEAAEDTDPIYSIVDDCTTTVAIQMSVIYKTVAGLLQNNPENIH